MHTLLLYLPPCPALPCRDVLCWLLFPLQLLAVSTSKACLQLSPSATFEGYLAAEYAADAISETLIDPLTPSGIEAMSSSKDRSNKGSSSSTQGGDASNHSSSVSGPAGERTGDAAAATSSKGSKKWGRGSSSSKGASKEEAAAAAAGASSSSGAGRVLKARCWMAQDFPMSLQQLLPLLDVIGNANKHMAKVGLLQHPRLTEKLQGAMLGTAWLLLLLPRCCWRGAVCLDSVLHCSQQQPQALQISAIQHICAVWQ